ncbi:MAG: hypothetical protein P8X82_19295 [Gemmatimonadales bacterium]|jgi:TolB-like protein
MIRLRDPVKDREIAGTETPAVGVLPFINVSGNPRMDDLSNAITHDVVEAFAKLSECNLEVRRCSLFPSNTNVHIGAIGWCLDVALLLLGNVSEKKGMLLTTAQLICVGDGTAIWSGGICCDSAARSTIASEIAKQIELRMSSFESRIREV